MDLTFASELKKGHNIQCGWMGESTTLHLMAKEVQRMENNYGNYGAHYAAVFISRCSGAGAGGGRELMFKRTHKYDGFLHRI